MTELYPTYAFEPRNDGPGNTIYAKHVNDLQSAVAEISTRRGDAAPRLISGAHRVYDLRQLFFTPDNPGTISLIPNTTLCMPFAISSPCHVTAIGCRVTTGAGSVCRLGLYRNDGDIGPGTLLASGTVNPATTGLKLTSITLQNVQFSTPQVVWLAINADSNSTEYEALTNIRNRPLGMDQADGSTFSGMVKTADGAGSTLPDPFTGDTFWDGSGNRVPNLYLTVF